MTTLMWIEFSAILLCVLFEGFFSGSEIAIISVDKIKLRHLVSLGSKGAKQAHAMLQQPERFLGTTLVGTNISVVLASVLLTSIFSQISQFSKNVEFYVALILTPLVLLFGEIIPKSVFQQHADTLVPIIARPLHVAFTLFYPLVSLVSGITNAILSMLGVEKNTPRHSFTREELKFLIQTDPQANVADQQRQEMMRRVFEFGDTTVEEILLPLVEVTALEKGTSIAEAIQKIQESGFSRLPIYEERVDQIIGVIHAFDLLLVAAKDTYIDPFIRKAYYVPKMMPLVELVQNMQRHRTQIALVVDEYGGSLGIVTLEDCLEEIVGDIDDEFDEFDEDMYQKLADGSFRINARMEIDEINNILKFDLPEGTFETLGGFLLSEFHHIPSVGETLEYKGLRFRVENTTARSILWVHITFIRQGG
ncbi:MAG: HlyC/CorC family transporter [bacterium]|nr:HlyC/CorC family transporter [bacterium]